MAPRNNDVRVLRLNTPLQSSYPPPTTYSITFPGGITRFYENEDAYNETIAAQRLQGERDRSIFGYTPSLNTQASIPDNIQLENINWNVPARTPLQGYALAPALRFLPAIAAGIFGGGAIANGSEIPDLSHLGNQIANGAKITWNNVKDVVGNVFGLNKPSITISPELAAILQSRREYPSTEGAMSYPSTISTRYNPSSIDIMAFRNIDDLNNMRPEVKEKLKEKWNSADAAKKKAWADKRGTSVEEMDKIFNPPAPTTGGNDNDDNSENNKPKKDPNRNNPFNSRFWVKETSNGSSGWFNTGYRPTWQGLTTGVLSSNYTIPTVIDGVSLGLQTATGSELHGPAAIPLRSQGTYIYHPKTGFLSDPNKASLENHNEETQDNYDPSLFTPDN